MKTTTTKRGIEIKGHFSRLLWTPVDRNLAKIENQQMASRIKEANSLGPIPRSFDTAAFGNVDLFLYFGHDPEPSHVELQPLDGANLGLAFLTLNVPSSLGLSSVSSSYLSSFLPLFAR